MTPRPPAKAARPGILSAAAATLVLLASPGCGGPEARQLLASGSGLLARNDAEGAKLQAKSVLQQQPDSGPARLLLGRALLAGGDLAGAESELRRAQALGQPAELVLPPLAQALVGQGKGSLALQLPAGQPLKDAEAEASYQTQRAQAHAQSGQRAEAQAAVAQALAAVPGHAPARLLAARLTAVEGDAAAALQQVSAVLADMPEMAEAWLLKAELLRQQPGADRAGVEAALGRAVSAQPTLVPAQQALVMWRLTQGDLPGAKAQWTKMHQAAPRHPQTLLLEAVLAEQAGELPRARDITQLLLRAAPDHPPLLLLAAQVERRLGALAQAETLLARAVQRLPQAATARLQLAQVQLQAAAADKALATLKPVLDAADAPAADSTLSRVNGAAQAAAGASAAPQPLAAHLADATADAAAPSAAQRAQAFTLAAQARLQLGDTAAADTLFSRAAALQPSQLGVRTSLALARLAKSAAAGQPPEPAAQAELQAIAQADPGTAADTALINLHLRAGQFDAALTAVEAMARKQTDLTVAPLLRAQIAVIRQQPDEARRQFGLVLAQRPDALPALVGLAQMDLAAQRPQEARARLAALVDRQPQHAAALRALAEVTARSGGSGNEVAELLRRAVLADPKQLAAQVALLDQLLASQAWRPALEAAQAALAALPDQPELLARQARAQLATGQPQQAVASLGRLAQREPRSAWPQLQLAEAHARAGQSVAAAEALRKAAELAPDDPAVLQAQAVAALQQKRFDVASTLARRLQALRPRDAGGQVLAGDVALAQRHWAAAAAAYRQGLALPQPGDSAQRLHSALLAAGELTEARRVAADWRQRQPEDMGFARYLGDAALAQGQVDAAEGLYRQVTAKRPTDAVALNNLAYTLALQKKPGGSALARQALAQTPDAPAVLDTLAFCLAAEGELPQALRAQRQAVEAAPDAPGFRLQLAKLQLQAGDKPAALAELAVLARLGSGFARQAEVATLLKSAGT